MREILIDAVCGEAEEPAFAAACAELGEGLDAASPGDWQVRSRLRRDVSGPDAGGAPAILAVSFIREAMGDEAFGLVEARWRKTFSELMRREGTQIFACTVFRRHSHEPPPNGAQDAIAPRIRRLNLMLIQASHDLGIGVIDLDRVFASIGARRAKTDFRMAGPMAAEIAGHTIAMAYLDAGLDSVVPAIVLERAKEHLRNSHRIRNVLQRQHHEDATHTDANGRPGAIAVDASDPGV